MGKSIAFGVSLYFALLVDFINHGCYAFLAFFDSLFNNSGLLLIACLSVLGWDLNYYYSLYHLYNNKIINVFR